MNNDSYDDEAMNRINDSYIDPEVDERIQKVLNAAFSDFMRSMWYGVDPCRGKRVHQDAIIDDAAFDCGLFGALEMHRLEEKDYTFIDIN